jgi:hypothetical protein
MTRRILITGARAPVALHLARLLSDAGCAVHLADSLRRPLAAASRRHQGCHVLPAPRRDMAAYGAALADLIRAEQIDCVIPTCEEVLYLVQIWRDGAMPCALFAPDAETVITAHDKWGFIRRCQALGLPVPATHLVQNSADLQQHRPQARALVFKPRWSRFASHVLIRPRLRDLDRITPDAQRPWVAQDYIAGEEISLYAIAHHGRLMALSAYRGLIRAGLGASVAFAPVEDPAMDDFAACYVAGTGWHGQIAFDVIRDAKGQVWPIECNPRATSGLHFFTKGADFLAGMAGQAVVAPDIRHPLGVPLAVWLYGLPGVIRPGGLRALIRTLRQMGDVMAWPGDGLSYAQQLRPFAEIARIARAERISLQAAATRDIEWDGPDQRSI